MARDARLAGHGSNYFSGNEPQRYIDFTKDVFERKSKVDYATLFTVPADSFETPFSPGRFNETDIRKSLSARKQKLNPGLGFVEFKQDEEGRVIPNEVFAGIGGPFNRQKDYNFNDGRPNTRQRPEDQPDYNPMWKEMYAFSPTVEERSENPMPRMSNPDPKGRLMAQAESKAKNEVEDNKSVAQLLAEDKGDKDKKEDEKNSKA
jgi:hypothetical protein